MVFKEYCHSCPDKNREESFLGEIQDIRFATSGMTFGFTLKFYSSLVVVFSVHEIKYAGSMCAR